MEDGGQGGGWLTVVWTGSVWTCLVFLALFMVCILRDE